MVLVVLVIAGALQEHLDAVAVCGDQAPGTASCSRRAWRHSQRQHGFPLGQSVRLAGSHEASGDLHHSRAAMYFFRPSMP
jgi:hypothetical protein